MKRSIPNKGDVYYVVFTTNGEIIKLDANNTFFRLDVKLIIKRTFIKTSGGKREYDYYKNQILDSDFKVKRNNRFEWNGVKCRIIPKEYWGEVTIGKSHKSILFNIEVTDKLNKVNFLKYNMASPSVFEEMKNDLDIIDRVGTHQGFIEIQKLNAEIAKLKKKL